MITDVFPTYVVYITAFDALIVLPFLYRSYRVQEVQQTSALLHNAAMRACA